MFQDERERVVVETRERAGRGLEQLEQRAHVATGAQLKVEQASHAHATALLNSLQASLDEAVAGRRSAEHERDRLADVLARKGMVRTGLLKCYSQRFLSHLSAGPSGDARLGAFAGSLFGPSSVSFERELHTREENARVDRSVVALLRLLSPHFLRAAAHRVLEFLNISSNDLDDEGASEAREPDASEGASRPAKRPDVDVSYVASSGDSLRSAWTVCHRISTSPSSDASAGDTVSMRTRPSEKVTRVVAAAAHAAKMAAHARSTA